MTNHEAPEHFMSPRFFENVKAVGGVAIHADVEKLAGMDLFVRENSGFGLPDDPSNIDFFYFWTTGEDIDNLHFHNAERSTRFVPSASLGYEDTFSVPLWEVEARQRTVVELQTKDLKRQDPLTFAAARSMTAQSPEQAGILANSEAWKDYVQRRGNPHGVADALINGFLPERFTRANRLAEAATRLFPGAIVLERRPEIEAPGGRPAITGS